MKKMFFGALAGCLLLAGSVAPALAAHDHDHGMMTNHDVVKLDEIGTIQGKVTAIRNGQVILQTADGQFAEVPHMAVFWGTEPRQVITNVAVGNEVMVFLPEDYVMRIINRDNNQFLLGSYEGIYRLPQQMVVSWDLEDDTFAER